MKENKLKSMAENNKFEELMNDRQELELLSKIKDISEVLEVLNKYGYNGNKHDLERDLFEILQGLSEDDLKNISGGKILNKKYLAGLMGGLTMMGAMGLETSAQDGNQSNVKTKSATSFLNKVDKNMMGIVGGSLAVGGIFVEALNLMFRKTKIEEKADNIGTVKIENNITQDINLELSPEEQQIYNDTAKLSRELLNYVENYVKEKHEVPPENLDPHNTQHQKMLNLISKIRDNWLRLNNMATNCQLNPAEIHAMLANENTWLTGIGLYVPAVQADGDALARLFENLPIQETHMTSLCMPVDLSKCEKRLGLAVKLYSLSVSYAMLYDYIVSKWVDKNPTANTSVNPSQTSDDEVN